MAELATVARPYAEALFDVSGNDLAATQAWLNDVASVTGNVGLLEFAANPKVRPDQIVDLVKGVLRAPLPPQGVDFLRTVIDNGRLAAVPEVARQYGDLVNSSRGVSDAVIQSAFPMTEADVAELLPTLERRFGHKLKAVVSVDPALIGGVRVSVGDEVLDTSVKARLDQMRTALAA